jgi:hypothetical protein
MSILVNSAPLHAIASEGEVVLLADGAGKPVCGYNLAWFERLRVHAAELSLCSRRAIHERVKVLAQ